MQALAASCEELRARTGKPPLNLSFSIFCFLRRRETEFALAHRRLRVQRLSQNAIDSPRFRDLDITVRSAYLCT